MQNHAIDPFGIVGQVLDAQFRVDRLVGEGGFSAVYRGHHLGLDEPIAIKCLKLPPALSPALVDEFAKRFRDESRILYRLSQGNLNVVRSIAAGTWQAPATGLVVPFMILEWMEGRSLANDFTIRRTGGRQGRSLEELVELFGSAADGLGHAHSQGVVHRDLNPGNFFLASTPQGMRMKVLDFGVAKILDDSTLDIARTQTVGQIRIFAPAYGAPEQFDDRIGKVGAASDVYSFALILLEALRDRCVNEGQHLGEFAQRTTDPIRRPTPRTLGVDVSDEVEQAFARATRLDPRERWQSARELWQALSHAVSATGRQEHAQAARETPPPAVPLPPGARSTQGGMPPPPHLAPKAPGARMDKTMPLGAVMPKMDAPRPAAGAPPPSSPRLPASPPASSPRAAGAPGAPSSPRVAASPGAPASSPRVPARPGAEQPPTERFPGDGAERGLAPPSLASDDAESEDEVTRVRAPEPDVLRGLADIEARGRPVNTTMTQVSPGNAPRPAAGNPPPAAGAPISSTLPPPPQPPEPAPPSGGTLMMAPGAFGPPPAGPTHPMSPPEPSQVAPPPAEVQRPAGGGHLAQTLPLTGPHPLGLPGQPSQGGPAPAAGVPAAGYPQPSHPQQHAHAAPAHASPHPEYGHPSQPHQQPHPHAQQPHPHHVHASHHQGPQAHPSQPNLPAAQHHQGSQAHPSQPNLPAAQHHHAPQAHPSQPGLPGAHHQAPPPHVPMPPHGSGSHFGSQHAHQRLEESMSMAPASVAGVPKKNNTVLFVALALGALALVGVVLGLVVVLGGKGDGPGPVASTSAPSASLVVASAPPAPPPPPPVVEPDPVVATDEVDAGAVVATDEIDAGVEPPSAPTGAPPVAPPDVAPAPAPVVVRDAGPPPDPNAFNEAAARSRLGQANGILVFCKKEGGVTGPGTAGVTFSPDGAVSAVTMDPPYAGTPAGDCVAGHFKRTKANPFQGSPRTIKHAFEVPK
ncbi:MAG: protein kinase [Labilithrix sp.]|nr:protein kinase [Labilithrix sp.]